MLKWQIYNTFWTFCETSALKCLFSRIFIAAFWWHVCPEPQANTAELLKSNYGTTCNELNKLEGLRGRQQGRGEDSGPFHGSIYHPWGHEPRHVTHTHEHTHVHKNTHMNTRAPWWHPKQPSWGTAVYDRAHTSYSKRLAVHTRTYEHTQSWRKRCNTVQ